MQNDDRSVADILRTISHSLTWRLTVLTLVWVMMISGMIGYTFVLTSQSYNNFLSLTQVSGIRAGIYRANLMTTARFPRRSFDDEINLLDSRIDQLEKVSREEASKAAPTILHAAQNIHREWQSALRAKLIEARRVRTPMPAEELGRIIPELSEFKMILENDRDAKEKQIHRMQTLLILMTIISLIGILLFLFRWIIRPIDQLRDAIDRFTKGDLAYRLNLKGSMEFERIGTGFNRMAQRLESLVSDLEANAQQKTAALDERNRNLAQLYEMSSFLGRIQDVSEMSESFTLRLMHYTGAAAAAVFLVNTKTERLELAAHTDLTPEIIAQFAQHDLNVQDAEDFLMQGEGLRLDPSAPGNELFRHLYGDMQRYPTVYCFHVQSAGKNLGIYMLYYSHPVTLSARRNQLYENFGTHLAIAIANCRLIAKEQQYAVVQERNFIARGLHDSIAQSLSFLNLQVQLLETGLKANDKDFVAETVQQLKTGVQESYSDVRELLLNFRERLHREPFPEALASVIERFKTQTHISVKSRTRGEGPELSEIEKLQVLFIVQEALANVRKHANASEVTISVTNRDDFELSVCDNGCGIDPKLQEERKSSHFGLSIMKERAERISATVEIESAPEDMYPHGTCVRLNIPPEVHTRAK